MSTDATPASIGADALREALIKSSEAILSMKVEAETAAQGDEQMMLEACEQISNEGLEAYMAIRATLASAAQPAAVPHAQMTKEIDNILSDPDTRLSPGAERALSWLRTWTDAPLVLAAAPKAESVPAGAREELREGASYESMNLAAMVLSDCGHSSNYKPLLERVAGRIDRHVERLLTAQRADLTVRAQAAPAAVTGPSDEALRLSVDHAHEILRRLMYHRDGDFFINVNRSGAEALHTSTIATIVHAALVAAPTTQAAPAAQVDALDAELGRVAMGFVDRAGDVRPGIDDAETICAEFHAAMSAVIERMPHVQRMNAANKEASAAARAAKEGA